MKSYSVLVLCTPVLGVEWNRTPAAINDTMLMSDNPNTVNVVSGVTNSHLFFDGLSCNGRILQWTVPKNERCELELNGTFRAGSDIDSHLDDDLRHCTYRVQYVMRSYRILRSCDQNNKYGCNEATIKPRKTCEQDQLSKIRIAVFGDMASSTMEANKKKWKPPGHPAAILPAITASVVERGEIDTVVYLGDIGYEFYSKNAIQFMADIAPIARLVPFHATIGNHEMENNLEHGTLTTFDTYFKGQELGVGTTSSSSSSRYYSYDIGNLVHMIVLNTELYGDEKEYWNAREQMSESEREAARSAMKTQSDWLQEDLQKTLEKTTLPYIIVSGHRALFDMPSDPYDMLHNAYMMFLEDIGQHLSDVDVYLCGHQHALYAFEATSVPFGERLLSLPPMLLSGASGGTKALKPFKKGSIPSAFTLLRDPVFEYGYFILVVTQGGGIQWEMHLVDIIDDIMQTTTTIKHTGLIE